MFDERTPLTAEDMWRAYNRQLYNKTAGKQGYWARGRDAVAVPNWYKKRLEKRGRQEDPQKPLSP